MYYIPKTCTNCQTIKEFTPPTRKGKKQNKKNIKLSDNTYIHSLTSHYQATTAWDIPPSSHPSFFNFTVL